MRRGTTSSCQSAASSKIVKALICSRIYSCKQRYSKYSIHTFAFYLCVWCDPRPFATTEQGTDSGTK